MRLLLLLMACLLATPAFAQDPPPTTDATGEVALQLPLGVGPVTITPQPLDQEFEFLPPFLVIDPNGPLAGLYVFTMKQRTYHFSGTVTVGGAAAPGGTRVWSYLGGAWAKDDAGKWACTGGTRMWNSPVDALGRWGLNLPAGDWSFRAAFADPEIATDPSEKVTVNHATPPPPTLPLYGGEAPPEPPEPPGPPEPPEPQTVGITVRVETAAHVPVGGVTILERVGE